MNAPRDRRRVAGPRDQGPGMSAGCRRTRPLSGAPVDFAKSGCGYRDDRQTVRKDWRTHTLVGKDRLGVAGPGTGANEASEAG